MSKSKSFRDAPYMVCGCKAMAVTDDGEPFCIAHHCDEVDEEMSARLEGRTARCSYYGKEHHRCECNYSGCVEEEGEMICRCEEPSVKALPFFQYKGPESMAAVTDCKHCRYSFKAHLPRWTYKLVLHRDWHKHKNITQEWERTIHARNRSEVEEYLKAKSKQMIDFSRSPSVVDGSPSETVIHKIEIESIEGPLSSGRGHKFEEHGPYEYDEFYCGCHSWN